MKNNYLIYANASLKHILEISNINSKDDNKNERLKNQLMITNINPYFSHTTETIKGSSTNVWQFLTKNEKGATYELKGNASRCDEELPSTKKYITLNQVKVNF